MSIVVRGAIVSLVAFYLYVLYLIANPNVSAAYREYYILKSTGLSIAERKKLQPLELSRNYVHKDTAIGFDGWSGPEETHRWSDGKLARIIFRLPARAVTQAPQRLVLNLGALGSQRTRWRLNGTEIAERQVASEVELALPVKPGLLREGENVLEIDLPDAHRPGNGDGRLLGLAFKSLRLE